MAAPMSLPTLMRVSPASLAFVLTLHALAFWLLLQMNVIRLPIELPVLMIDLVKPEVPEPPKPKVEPPKPRPLEKKPVPRPLETPPVITAPETSPAPAPVIVPPPPEPVPAPIIAPPAPPAPAPIVQPRFDADYLDNPKPTYPPISRRLGEEGRVVLRVLVSAEGRPIEVRIHHSSGSERLDSAALAAVQRWRFVPARQGEEPIAASVLVPIVFSLKE